jgi:hypothetical protein
VHNFRLKNRILVHKITLKIEMNEQVTNTDGRLPLIPGGPVQGDCTSNLAKSQEKARRALDIGV